jgi:signal transduction histidine kinase
LRLQIKALLEWAVERDLVEAHGGRVTGRSEGDGQGSEFVVTLPLI